MKELSRITKILIVYTILTVIINALSYKLSGSIYLAYHTARYIRLGWNILFFSIIAMKLWQSYYEPVRKFLKKRKEERKIAEEKRLQEEREAEAKRLQEKKEAEQKRLQEEERNRRMQLANARKNKPANRPQQFTKMIFKMAPGQVFSSTCFVYNNKTGELMFECEQGDSVTIQTSESIEVTCKIRMGFGKETCVLHPGKIYAVYVNWYGHIAIDEVEYKQNSGSSGFAKGAAVGGAILGMLLGESVDIDSDGGEFCDLGYDDDGMDDMVGFDIDNDGIDDTFGFDTDDDGMIDTVAMDTDGDGGIDVVGVDWDGDGDIDDIYV